MTGKERVAMMRRHKAKKKVTAIIALVIDIAVTISILLVGLNTNGIASITLLGIGTILLEFNYLAILWSVPIMLKIHGILPSVRKLLSEIAGTERCRLRPKVFFFRGIAISFVLTASTLFFMLQTFG